jgi:hypothetical protein
MNALEFFIDDFFENVTNSETVIIRMRRKKNQRRY